MRLAQLLCTVYKGESRIRDKIKSFEKTFVLYQCYSLSQYMGSFFFFFLTYSKLAHFIFRVMKIFCMNGVATLTYTYISLFSSL